MLAMMATTASTLRELDIINTVVVLLLALKARGWPFCKVMLRGYESYCVCSVPHTCFAPCQQRNKGGVKGESTCDASSMSLSKFKGCELEPHGYLGTWGIGCSRVVFERSSSFQSLFSLGTRDRLS